MTIYSAGFRQSLPHLRWTEDEARLLPATTDRAREAEFFGTLAADTPPVAEYADVVNWHMSAFVSAVTGIRDACGTDFERLGRKAEFEQAPLAGEFFLSHVDPNPLLRDPVAINRALWDLRNLRVHYAIPLVELHTHKLDQDLYANPEATAGAPRWYLRPIKEDEIRLLRNAKLDTTSAQTAFNRWVGRHPLPQLVFQHLCNLSIAIRSTAEALNA
jgi:hypothetical protein